MIVQKAGGPAGSRFVAPALLMMVATLLTAAGLLVVGVSPAEAASTFTVNKVGVGGDRNIDGACDASRATTAASAP